MTGLLRILPTRRQPWPEPVTSLLSPSKLAFKLMFINQSFVSLVGKSHPSELADFIKYLYLEKWILNDHCGLSRAGSATEESLASINSSICVFLCFCFYLPGLGLGEIGEPRIWAIHLNWLHADFHKVGKARWRKKGLSLSDKLSSLLINLDIPIDHFCLQIWKTFHRMECQGWFQEQMTATLAVHRDAINKGPSPDLLSDGNSWLNKLS